MAFFDFLKTNKNGKQPEYTTHNNFGIANFYGAQKNITEEDAISIPAFAASLDLITSSIARLDFYLVRKNEKSEIERIEDERLYLLNKEANERMDAFTFKRALVRDYLLYGASSSVIEREGNKVVSLNLLPTKDTSISVYADGYKKYGRLTFQTKSGNYQYEDYELLTVLRNSKDGFTGEGILNAQGKILSKALDESTYASNVLKNGALPIGVLKAEKKLSDAAFANLKKSWSSLYEGSDKAGKTVILEEGLDYKAISLDPNKLELTESKKETISEIARLFNIPETMINSNAGKYGSNEQNSISFLQYCISPIVTAIESSLNKSLLLEKEKEQGLEFRIDSSRLLQMTRKERAEAIGSEYNAGLLSFYEARAELDLPEKAKKDYFRLSLGAVLYKYEDDEMVIPNTMQSKTNIKAEEESKQIESKNSDSNKEKNREESATEEVDKDESN